MTEFDDVIQRLEADRPQVTDRELDGSSSEFAAARRILTEGAQSMKSRLAILAMLVTGMLFSTAGVGLALQGGAQRLGGPVRRVHADAERDGPPTDTGRPSRVASTATSARRAASSRPRTTSRPAPRPSPKKGGVLPAQAERVPTRSLSASARPRPRRASCRSPASRRSRPARRPRAADGGLILRRRTAQRTQSVGLRPPAGSLAGRRRPAARCSHPASVRANGSSGFSRTASRRTEAGPGPPRRARSPAHRRAASCRDRVARRVHGARRERVWSPSRASQ